MDIQNMFADIQKVVPPSGTPRRVLYQGPPRSPTGTRHEVMGEVALVRNPPTAADPSQQGDGSRPGSFGKTPEKTRFFQVRRKSTGFVRTWTWPVTCPGLWIGPALRTGPRPDQTPNSESKDDSG